MLLAGLWGAAAGALAGAANGDCPGELSEFRSSALNSVGLAAGDVTLPSEVCCWVGPGLRNKGAEGMLTDGEGGVASDSVMSRAAAGDGGDSGEARCCC